ncbi:ATP-binding cassette domain-containing protein [Massilistercora timonensis]|uniref:ABC transporter ATP-binding protein/permease n=1 Tax=Massilistercora timonensis TaxID=2086584 RepID=UPI003AB269AE
MLQIKHICKEYRTGSLVQKALDDVSLNLRDNEFVSILGPSGSGKTTLLNIIGGLDRYDSGDLIINGVSTRKYKDRDWDSYRNHTIGFVFQSYNLIPHQTILANVELALTISGIGKSERRQRAQKALDEVGLGDQVHKRPSQLSGGQMQRVAIARALVNDPDILLADEPTGALDSETSIQVMDLLKQVAKDRLVVMVTHNPELAQAYSTRIVNLRDGRIRSDSNPFEIDETTLEEPEHRNMGKASMSFLTALSLSFNNLRTKKARTLLTSFAGSIGIIGIALILALSNGVNAYIKSIETDTLAEYPLQIQSTGLDLSSMMGGETGGGSASDTEKGDVGVIQMVTNMFSTMDSNDLGALKSYLDSGKSGIEKYTHAIEYSYSITPQIYRLEDSSVRQVHPDRSFEELGLGSSSGSNSMMSAMMSTDVFYEMPENTDLYQGQYDVKAGRWPQNYNECVIVLTSSGNISDFLLYTLGLRDSDELDAMIQQFIDEENVDTPEDMGDYSYEDLLGASFKLVNSSDYYQYDSQYKVWTDKTDDSDYMRDLVEQGEDIRIVGVVQPSEDGNGFVLTSGIGYTPALTRHVAQQAQESQIVQKQLEDPDINVFTGEPFGEDSSENDFDMESLVTIDEGKLGEAFGFDESAFSDLSSSFDFADVFASAGDSMDLSGLIDLGNLNIDLPDLGTVDLEEMMGSMEIPVSQEGFRQMAASLMEGFNQYGKEHPEADYSGLQSSFEGYLKTDAAKKVMKEAILEIVKKTANVTVSNTQVQKLLSNLKEGFKNSLSNKEPATVDDFYHALESYMSGDGLSVVNSWADDIAKTADVTITDAQMESLSSALVSGYSAYAKEQGKPDPTQMGLHFLTYLQTEDGQRRLAEGLAATVDTDALEDQLMKAVETYMGSAMASYGNAIGDALKDQISSALQQMMTQLASGMTKALGGAMSNIGSALQDAISVDADAFAEAFQMNMTGEDLTELMMSMSSGQDASYDGNLTTLGYVDFAEPSSIDIYPLDFESKEQVVSILDHYNSRMEEEGKDEQVITYTDLVGSMMSSVTDIIDIISYVLIAFVAISLIVSSIMIGVITYISVLERKKEIGILRAIGASKQNISQVFNAETFIIGLCAGLIGIGATLLILIPGNALIHHIADTNDVNAFLPVVPAVILILLSVILTLLGGLIPSRKAAKSDPVTALRTE